MASKSIDPTDVSTSTWDTAPHVILSTKYGHVDARFIGNDQVMCQVCDADGRQAHINDNVDGLTYRGNRYIGAPRFVLRAAGFVAQTESYDALKNESWKSAPATYNAAMVEAIREALTTHIASVDPCCVAAGNLAHLRNELRRAIESEAEALNELATRRGTVSGLKRAIADAAAEVAYEAMSVEEFLDIDPAAILGTDDAPPPVPDGVEISVYRSIIDGKIIVEIDTENVAKSDHDERSVPLMRVTVNDDKVWEN